MKRFVVLLSILVLAFLVAACGNNAQARRQQEQPAGETVQQLDFAEAE